MKMNCNRESIVQERTASSIYLIRDQQVLIYSHSAEMYGV